MEVDNMEIWKLTEDTELLTGKKYKKGTKFFLTKTVDNLGFYFSLDGSDKTDLVVDYATLKQLLAYCGNTDN